MREPPAPVLFENNHVLAVVKPAGLLTQPTPEVSESLENMFKVWIKEKYHKTGNVFLTAIHRLDKPVGGIVIFAKTSKALSRLNESMRDGKIVKTYVATVEGRMPSEEGVLEHYLVHEEYRADVVSRGVAGAKFARLKYRVLQKDRDVSVVEIELETGRYHQIRAQCAAVGAPIVGDGKYGSTKVLSDGTIALRHTRVSFPHPVSQEIITLNLRG
jgi:23S rRNA pseudouridine1911/1915/1917 synthase